MVDRFVLLPMGAEFPISTNMYPCTLEAFHNTERRMMLGFAADTIQMAAWTRVLPTNWTGTAVAKIYYACAANSGKVDFVMNIEAVSSGDSLDLDAAVSYDADNTITAPTVPGTAGYLDAVDCTLSSFDSGAGGDLVRFRVRRDATDGTNDTAAGKAYIAAINIKDEA